MITLAEHSCTMVAKSGTERDPDVLVLSGFACRENDRAGNRNGAPAAEDGSIDRTRRGADAPADFSRDGDVQRRSHDRLRLLGLHVDRSSESADAAQRVALVARGQPADRHDARDADPALARAGAARPRDRVHARSRRPPVRARRRPAVPALDGRAGAGLLRAGHRGDDPAGFQLRVSARNGAMAAGVCSQAPVRPGRAGGRVRGAGRADHADPARARQVAGPGFSRRRVGLLHRCEPDSRRELAALGGAGRPGPGRVAV